MAAHRPAKEGVTAVAGAAGSAARRQPTPTGRGARVPQQSRVEPADSAGTQADSAVAVVEADSASARGQAPAERATPGSRRSATPPTNNNRPASDCHATVADT